MGSSSKSPVALFLVMNLVMFAAVASAANTCSLLGTLTGILPLSVCGGGLANIVLGGPCCTCLSGLTDLDAAVCLCAAIKAKVCVLGAGVDATVYITSALASCGRTCPSGYTCSLL